MRRVLLMPPSQTPITRPWAARPLDNCRCFLGGQPLRNVVDRARWF
jgi:hypothetical protein